MGATICPQVSPQSKRKLIPLVLRLLRRKRQRVVEGFKKALIPTSAWSTLGRILTALSLFTLIQSSLTLGLSSLLSLTLSVYIHAIDLTIGRFDPFIKHLAASISTALGIHIHFHKGWRYIFVLLQMLFVRDAGTAFSDGRYALGGVRLFVGTALSLTCSLFVFTPASSNNILANVIFCTIPIVGLLLYDIAMYVLSSTVFFRHIGIGEIEQNKSRSQFLLIGLRRLLERFLIVGTASWIIFTIPSVQSYKFPDGGILAMITGTVGNCIYWLSYAALYARAEARLGKRFRKAFTASEAGRFGLAVTGVIFWVIVFCLVNAGSRLVGL